MAEKIKRGRGRPRKYPIVGLPVLPCSIVPNVASNTENAQGVRRRGRKRKIESIRLVANNGVDGGAGSGRGVGSLARSTAEVKESASLIVLGPVPKDVDSYCMDVTKLFDDVIPPDDF